MNPILVPSLTCWICLHMQTTGGEKMKRVIHDFPPLSHTDIYSYRKCACPANRSHRAGHPFTSKPASRSHRNRQAVHIDAGHSFTSTCVNGLVVQLVHIENCTLSARKNAPSQGEKGKKKSLDFSRLFRVGGRNRTRTCDPIDVNDVLYQLSHATMSFPTKVPVGTTN